MSIIQYDMPQRPYAEESFTPWAYDQYSHVNAHSHLAFHPNNLMPDDAMYHDMGHNRYQLQRYLHSPPPNTQSFIPEKLEHVTPLQVQVRQWPSTDAFSYSRNGSPDTTSLSGTSSHATHNEVHSPHPYHSAPFANSADFSHQPLSYPHAEHFGGVKFTPDLPMAGTGGSINPRELQYQQHEPVVEEHEQVDMKPEIDFDQEPATTHVESAVSDDRRTFVDPAIAYSSRDAESVQPMSISDREESDSDYKPIAKSKPRRPSAASNSSNKHVKRRRGRKSFTSPAGTTSPRITKKNGRSSGTSPTASKAGHTHGNSPIDAESQRPFPCPLAAYGCTSNFVSKNEWKRHVSTQHIKLGFWRCDLCTATVDPHDDSSVYHNDFNRKDLFTQHLRRMHSTPTNPASSPTRAHRNTTVFVTEDNIASHQQRCYQSLRSTPPQSACLFCEREFTGLVSWEERMEHVGRHLEKERKGTGINLDPQTWRRDELLEQWLLEEGLIELEDNGAWKIGNGVPRRPAEPQAEEEDDD